MVVCSAAKWNRKLLGVCSSSDLQIPFRVLGLKEINLSYFLDFVTLQSW